MLIIDNSAKTLLSEKQFWWQFALLQNRRPTLKSAVLSRFRNRRFCLVFEIGGFVSFKIGCFVLPPRLTKWGFIRVFLGPKLTKSRDTIGRKKLQNHKQAASKTLVTLEVLLTPVRLGDKSSHQKDRVLPTKTVKSSLKMVSKTLSGVIVLKIPIQQFRSHMGLNGYIAHVSCILQQSLAMCRFMSAGVFPLFTENVDGSFVKICRSFKKKWDYRRRKNFESFFIVLSHLGRHPEWIEDSLQNQLRVELQVIMFFNLS